MGNRAGTVFLSCTVLNAVSSVFVPSCWHICMQVSSFFRSSKGARGLLLTIVLLSTSMIIGDGVLTPAISVISAVVGIQYAAPSITTGATSPLADLNFWSTEGARKVCRGDIC